MDNREQLFALINKLNIALNQVKHPELDSLLRIPYEDCPYFSEFYEKRNYEKEWKTIDSDIFFDKFFNNLINYDQLFKKTSVVFKERLKITASVVFNEENIFNRDFTKKNLKKYPSWAKLWHEFCLKAVVYGEFPWEDENDNLFYLKYNSFQSDISEVNSFLGFDFYQEYNKLKQQYPNPLLDSKIQKQKNNVNKKVS